MPTTIAVNSAATPTPEVNAHFDLAANDVTTVTFSGVPDDSSGIEVIVVSSTAPVWFTVDNTAPAVRGPRSFIIPVGPAADTRKLVYGATRNVKLLSTASAVVSVQRVR